MAKRKSTNTYRRRKRRYYGNQHENIEERQESNSEQASHSPIMPRPTDTTLLKPTRTCDESEEGQCSSARKLKLSNCLQNFDRNNFNLIINFMIIKEVIELIGHCPDCKGSLELQDDQNARSGFVHRLALRCTKCNWINRFFASNRVNKDESATAVATARGNSRFDLNVRSVLAFREIGRGHEGMQTLAMFMNLSPPVTRSNYDAINKKLHVALKETVVESCQKAAKETRQSLDCNDDDIIQDCQVSVDGTWQKRGHISLNGLVTLISRENGKCLDYHVMSKKCKSCQFWEKRTNEPGYASWYANHDCQINHDRSAGAMESAGAVAMFKRSIDCHHLRYTSYIGDGDSSSYSDVANSQPYGDGVKIEKKECIGHVQKRMGTRCRGLRQSLKGVKLSDGKKISGRGRLTDKAINTLQNHYGMAIRQNIGNLYAMKKSIIAILHHSSAIEDDDEHHKYCPRTNTSWCKWWLDKMNGTDTYKKNLNLPLAIKEKLKPIFQDLSSDDLLKKCLHGQTQNENECLNSVIWKKCPKDVFVGRNVLELGVSSAVIEFNDGSCGIIDVYEKLGLVAGRKTAEGCKKKDKLRIEQQSVKSSEKSKKRRKKLRSLRKGYADKEEELEGGKSYSSGAH